MTNVTDPSFFHAVAAVPLALKCYVERQADAELLQALREAKFTVILSSRKVGKSSLLKRAFAALRDEGCYVCMKELGEADEGITAESWYLGLISALVTDALDRNGFVVEPGWLTWWNERTQLSPGQRFTDFLRTFFLEPTSQAWVIAIDEIDTTILLPFSDDFFAAIRRCQNARADQPMWGRLTFLLAGVASPAQLIKDNRRTPFNIGHAVSLSDFTADEAKMLLEGLGEPVDDAAHPALQRILDWTGGHPYLTQRVFLELAEDLEDSSSHPARKDWSSLVDQAVRDTFLRPGARVNEPHLEDIARRRIGDLNKPSDPRADPELKCRMLAIYGRALADKPVKDDPQSKPCVELKLCGLLVADKQDPSRLIVRNRIYRTVFDAAWVRAETPRNQWKRVAVAAVLLAVLAIGGVGTWQRQSRIADLVAQIEQEETKVPTFAVTELRGYYGQEQRVQELLTGFWARRIRLASAMRPRDEAAIVSLHALSMYETPEARLQARRVLSGSLSYVLATFRHTDVVYDAKFSEDGLRVVTASADAMARVWNAETGDPVGRVLKHEFAVNHAEFSDDGRRVVTASDDSTARIWNAETGEPLGLPLNHEGRINQAAFSANGRRVVTASNDGTAQVWDTDTGQPVGSRLSHRSAINHAEFSADGQRVVTASYDGTAQIWNAKTGEPFRILTHKSIVNHASFSKGGHRVVATCYDGTGQVWDVETGQSIGSPLKHQGIVKFAEFSEAERRVVTASMDGTARIWNAETGEPLGSPLRHTGPVLHASFSPDGRRVVTASADKTAQLWDAETSQPLGSPLKHEGAVNDASFSSDGQRVITASDDYTARIWVAETSLPIGSPLRIDAAVRYGEFSADGRRMLIDSGENAVRVWDAEAGKPLGAPLEPDGGVVHASLSADGRRAVTASGDKTAQVWDAETGQPIGSPMKHKAAVNYALFSLDGRRVVTASDDKTVRVWDAKTGQPICRPLRHEYMVFDASFSADGRRVVTASDDTTAQIWNADTGQPLVTFKHESVVVRAAFSADGRRVVTVSSYGVRIWDAQTGQQLGRLLYYDTAVNYAEFSPDGHCIVTASKKALTWHFEESPGIWKPQATVWPNGASWMSLPRFTNRKQSPIGEEIRIADSWTGGVLLIRDLSIREPEKGLPELDGLPDEVLKNYLKRFSLVFWDEQKSPLLNPAYPVLVPQDNATILRPPGRVLPLGAAGNGPSVPAGSDPFNSPDKLPH